MASGHAGTEGIRLVPADPDAIRAFVYPLPVKDLDGIGPAHAATLARFGLDTVGVLANTPLGTVQRILGARVGRRAYDRARGLDPRAIVPTALPASTSDQRLLDRDTLYPDLLPTEVLDTVVTIASRLRESHQVAGALMLTVSLAGGAVIERTRALAAPSAHRGPADRRDWHVALPGPGTRPGARNQAARRPARHRQRRD
ncbi:hypothetical protein [Streptomyces sp. NBC_00564]|uniref:DNA polymerase thumb domain-containing protein n=1 Tax=Streptomyces sp. NBC_00564 TaxID=2903663 RepID=UPI00352C92A6|nr:hypothetical protein OG256_14855 [Streptomyces sp. NBC_00564]